MSETQKPQPYTPPEHVITAGNEALAQATQVELELAEQAYAAYAARTEHRSAVTGAALPSFGACPPLVRAAWLSVATSPLAALKGCSLAEVAQGTCKP